MGTWTQWGPASRDSDIVDAVGEGEWHDAQSNMMVYSTMLNIMALAKNSSKVRAQWEDTRVNEIDLATFEIPSGYLYFPNSVPGHDASP